MRRSLLVVALAAVAFTAACSSAPTGPTNTLRAPDAAAKSGYVIPNG